MAGDTVELKDGKGVSFTLATYKDANGNKVGAVVLLSGGVPVGAENPLPTAVTVEIEGVASEATLAQLLARVNGTLAVKQAAKSMDPFIFQLTAATSQTVTAANVDRGLLVLRNCGTGDAWINFGEDAVIGDCLPLAAGGSLFFDAGTIPSNYVSAILADATKPTRIYVLQG